MRIGTIRPVYVVTFPKVLEDGVLYVARRFGTACHRCCCGCGTKIVTPLRNTEYRLTDVGGLVSLHPSIGNWNHPCRSHYMFRNGQVVEAGDMAEAAIDKGRAHDDAEKRAYFGRRTVPLWKRAWRWLNAIYSE